MYLLYVDLLGIKALWRRGRMPQVKAVFAQFDELVVAAASTVSSASVAGGGIRSDAAAIVFSEFDDALAVARELFVRAFGVNGPPIRFWLRGVLVEVPSVSLELASTAPAPLESLTVARLSDELLEAVAIEQGGVKGMRLLLQRSSLTRTVRERNASKIGERNFFPFRRLNNSAYPGPAAEGFDDFLWMAPTALRD